MGETIKPALTIQSVPPRFWRCGVLFTRAPQSFPAGHFSAEQVERLKAERMLVVEEHLAPHPVEPKAATNAGADDAGTPGGAARPAPDGAREAPGASGRARRGEPARNARMRAIKST
jgi:hypothetical protein